MERELGGGGMSHVFVAVEHALGRNVVVKVLPPEMAAGVSIDRFKREIALGASLQHPHIVPLLSAGEAGGLPYFTMPLVEGESLRGRLDRERLTDDQSLDVMRDVALALEYAHARGVVHRDIKPENILLTGRSAVVTDFGIARAITAATPGNSRTTLTAVGTVVGTPAYMAPEQAAGETADPRADLYAWGVMAYEMLSGKHPFASHTTAQALLAAHIAESPVPLAERRGDLPLSIATLVDRCLAKNPGDRPPDATAILAQLAESAKAAKARGRWIAPAYRVPIAITLVLVVSAAIWMWRGAERRRWAREEAIPAFRKLVDADRPLAAMLLLEQAARYAPSDTQIARVLATSTDTVFINSTPSGATVSVQDYLTPDSAWLSLGTTPLKGVRLPDGYLRWKVAKRGVGETVTAPTSHLHMNFALDSAVSAPDGMARVRSGRWQDLIAFVGWVGPYNLPEFFLDRYEVTNRQYQEFVDKGGYADQKFWAETFVQQGRELTREQAMAQLTDRTGRPGPSTWEGGHYPDGQAEYPVTGVSWYEASAYAAFVHKSLPAFAQWYRAAGGGDFARLLVQESNISRTAGLAPVGTYKGIGPVGTYDMAGNAREWIANALADGRRFIVGGSSRSPSYLYADPEALSPFDRSPENGFRCVRNTTPLSRDVVAPITPLERDFTKVRLTSDEVFRAYQAMYAYAHTPLNAKVEGVMEDTRDWRKEKITFDAAYGNERVSAYLFLPKNIKPPYQTILFFPSARVSDIPTSATLGDVAFFDYAVQSGRAVLYPVYQDTYERRATQAHPGASQAIELTIQRSRDVGRALDYLQTRPDIAADKIAYMGVSMGAAEGVIYATLAQERLKTVLFLDGGFFLGHPPPGGDQADFAPRLKKPVLMVNGRFDFTFSLDRAQLPLFRMLGTPSADKKHVALETSHDVTALRPQLVAEVLPWLDKYLGRVR